MDIYDRIPLANQAFYLYEQSNRSLISYPHPDRETKQNPWTAVTFKFHNN